MALPVMAIEAAKTVGKTALNALTGGWLQRQADKRQLKQQTKLMALETKNNKKMAEFNQQLALDMWDKTNYSAQVDQLKKAGLNTGLMYEGGGAGGSTQGAGEAGMVSAGQAENQSIGMGMQLGMQMQLLKAQKENIEADTQLKKTDAEKTAGVDTQEAQGRIAKMAAETTHEGFKAALTKLQTDYQQVENNIQSETAEFVVQTIKSSTEKAVGEAESAAAQGKIDEATVNSRIQEIRATSVAQTLTVGLIKEQVLTQKEITHETRAKVEKIAEEIIRMKAQTSQGERGLNQKDQEIILDRMRTEFGAGAEARTIRWIQAGVQVAGELKTVPMPKRQIGFK